MRKRSAILAMFVLMLLSVMMFKIDSTAAAKKNFRAFAVTNGFFGEKTNFTMKYKNGIIVLNGTMEYLKGSKGYKTTGKKVKFKKKRYRVAAKCKISYAAGTAVSKKSNLKKYLKKYNKKKSSYYKFRGYITVTVKKNKVVDVYITD